MVYLIRYSSSETIDLFATDTFVDWLAGLRDETLRARLLVRLDRLSDGNPGDSAVIRGGVSELRIHLGPGYRIYFARLDERRIVLLTGGTKRSQPGDIKAAGALLLNLRRGNDA